MDDEFSLKLAEALCDRLIATAPKLRRESDVYLDCDLSDTDKEATVGAAIEPVNASLVVANLLDEEVRFEREVAETVQPLSTSFDYELVATADKDGDVHCAIGAVIRQGDRRLFIVELRLPVILGLICSYGKCSRGDLVRLGTVLVRVGCQAIGRFGFVDSDLADLIAFLRFAIRNYRRGDSPAGEDKRSDIDPRTHTATVNRASAFTEPSTSDEVAS